VNNLQELDFLPVESENDKSLNFEPEEEEKKSESMRPSRSRNSGSLRRAKSTKEITLPNKTFFPAQVQEQM
jgi:hypothetical protein